MPFFNKNVVILRLIFSTQISQILLIITDFVFYLRKSVKFVSSLCFFCKTK